MQRSLILGTLIGAGLLTITVVGQQLPATPGAGGMAAGQQQAVGAIEKLADNVYRIPGAGGNSAVFVMNNGVLLVDTKNPNNGQAVLDQIRSVTDKPVTHIINTHTHGDHTGSNMFFPANVEIVAQENTKSNMEKMAAFQTPEGKVGLPDRTFKDKLTLFSGKDAVDLYYYGPAHTGGDALVVFRNARIMHAGDMFAGKMQPILDVNNGGSGVVYGDTIAKAAAAIKNIDKVVTGHSDVMTWQDFVDYGEFNRLFAAHARTSLAAGKSAEQAMADFKLPEKFAGYNLAGRGGAAGNFTTVYAELSAK
ncbi:MAG: MBL fold metallo-hydrolase [Steroidobacteraceae bacterium]